jgi:hypothetical protein
MTNQLKIQETLGQEWILLRHGLSGRLSLLVPLLALLMDCRLWLGNNVEGRIVGATPYSLRGSH